MTTTSARGTASSMRSDVRISSTGSVPSGRAAYADDVRVERARSLRDLAPDRAEADDEPRRAPHLAERHVLPDARRALFGETLRLLKRREYCLHHVLGDRHGGHVCTRQTPAPLEVCPKCGCFDARGRGLQPRELRRVEHDLHAGLDRAVEDVVGDEHDVGRAVVGNRAVGQQPHEGGVRRGGPQLVAVVAENGFADENAHQLLELIARHTRSAVNGMSRWRTPRCDSASTTAFCTAGVEPMVPDSPMPLAPSGLRGVGVSIG